MIYSQLTSLLIVAADEFPTVKVVILSIVGLLFLPHYWSDLEILAAS